MRAQSSGVSESNEPKAGDRRVRFGGGEEELPVVVELMLSRVLDYISYCSDVIIQIKALTFWLMSSKRCPGSSGGAGRGGVGD